MATPPGEEQRDVRQVEVIEDTLLECRGLLYAHGSLYVNANNSKGFYRLRDTKGDGRFDEQWSFGDPIFIRLCKKRPVDTLLRRKRTLLFRQPVERSLPHRAGRGPAAGHTT